MSITVVGSIAYDNLETPSGKRDNILGGAATHFSAAASFFTKVYMVGVVGNDFAAEHVDFFRGRGIDVSGLKTIPDGKTFRWTGHYLNDLNSAETLDTQLGVFATFDPALSAEHSDQPFLFLANIHPELQLKVLGQMKRPKLVAMDTMNLWINTTRDALQKVIEKVDLIFVNDGEAKLLTGEKNVMLAARKIQSFGPKNVVIKRGEYGALLFSGENVFAAPAHPVAEVVDPTGAGDTFAGGFMGYVAREGKLDEATLKRAVVCGSVMASFQVEDFSLDRLRTLKSAEINDRFNAIRRLAHFEPAPVF